MNDPDAPPLAAPVTIGDRLARPYVRRDGVQLWESVQLCDRHGLPFYARLKGSGQLSSWVCPTRDERDRCVQAS